VILFGWSVAAGRGDDLKKEEIRVRVLMFSNGQFSFSRQSPVGHGLRKDSQEFYQK
jgi:hypothetical protein